MNDFEKSLAVIEAYITFNSLVKAQNEQIESFLECLRDVAHYARLKWDMQKTISEMGKNNVSESGE